MTSILEKEKNDEIIKTWLSNLYHHKYEAHCREPSAQDTAFNGDSGGAGAGDNGSADRDDDDGEEAVQQTTA